MIKKIENPNATNVGGEDFWPLTTDQIERFLKAARNATSKKEELVGFVLPFTGLRNSSFCHMRSNWLEKSEKGLRIAVPNVETCTGGAGNAGVNNAHGKNLHDRNNPCYKCKSSTPMWYGGSDYHDNMWHPKTEDSGGRVIPIINEHTKDLLKWWFTQNDGIPMMHNAVNRRIESIQNRAGIDREITAHDLRTTFATFLARHEFDRRYTADVMGHAETSSTDPYYKFVGADMRIEFEDKWPDKHR